MGIAADAVLAQGGRVTGVIPTSMVDRELAHRGVTDLRIVASMHERKALMASLADAFLVLPGGMGTLDELCEILTWAQLGLHAKPVGLLDVRDYWRGFLAFLDTAVAEGFLRSGDRARLHVPDGCRGAGGRPARGRAGAGVKTLLAQLRLIFDAPAPAPLAPEPCTGARPGRARPRRGRLRSRRGWSGIRGRGSTCCACCRTARRASPSRAGARSARRWRSSRRSATGWRGSAPRRWRARRSVRRATGATDTTVLLGGSRASRCAAGRRPGPASSSRTAPSS